MVAVLGHALTRADIEAWSVDHLEAAASYWSTTAQAWEDNFATIHSGMVRPGGTPWEGTAADAAAESSWGDVVKVRGAGDALYTAARHATTGAGDLTWAKRQVLTAIEEAEAAGFVVEDDLTVRDKSVFGPPERQQQAVAHAHAIQAAVQKLVSIDKAVAGQITTALAPLHDLNFNGNGKHDPTVQMVDDHEKQPPPAPEPPPPTAKSIQDAIKDLPQGNDANVRTVRDPQQLKQFEDWVTQHATKFQSDPPYRGGQGSEYRLPDGTEVRIGPSKKYGTTVDLNVPEDQVTLPDGKTVKLHLDPKGGDIKLPPPVAPEPAPAPRQGETAPPVREPGAEPGSPPLRAPLPATGPVGGGALTEGAEGEGGAEGGGGGFVGGGGIVRMMPGLEGGSVD